LLAWFSLDRYRRPLRPLTDSRGFLLVFPIPAPGSERHFRSLIFDQEPSLLNSKGCVPLISHFPKPLMDFDLSVSTRQSPSTRVWKICRTKIFDAVAPHFPLDFHLQIAALGYIGFLKSSYRCFLNLSNEISLLELRSRSSSLSQLLEKSQKTAVHQFAKQESKVYRNKRSIMMTTFEMTACLGSEVVGSDFVWQSTTAVGLILAHFLAVSVVVKELFGVSGAVKG
uniref:Uncharacterized protein n=1 Tax=Cucumis melo TaxID=3656 RepID=A0A9I9EAE8_CUCME